MMAGWHGRAAAASVIGVVLVVWASVAAQKPTVDASMDSLVQELRALRLAVERSSAATAQAQVVIGRLQLQENRLATLGRMAQDARSRMLDGLQKLSSHQRELVAISRRLDETTAADERRHLEQAVAANRVVLRDLQIQVDSLQSADREASSALADEQSRWNDINERLETLERTLIVAQPPVRR